MTFSIGPETMPLTEHERSALEELKGMLQASYEVLDFRLFGSKARGDDSGESDIDVMVELREVNAEVDLDICRIVYTVNLKNDCLISVVLFGEDQLTRGPMDQSPLYRAIQREGIAL